jgi:protein-S-isoprenylcysteine O-methyltransferase Ste14
MNVVELLHSVVTGSPRRRLVLTPVGLLFFGGGLVLLVWIALRLDAAVQLPQLLPGKVGGWMGAVVAAAGAILCARCVAFFLWARGTPVPFNPPVKLITDGPYSVTRNPMLTGLFAILVGVGLLLHSASLALLLTPAFVAASVIELRLVEEPELERRFGADYERYRQTVPMFIPRIRLRS